MAWVVNLIMGWNTCDLLYSRSRGNSPGREGREAKISALNVERGGIMEIGVAVGLLGVKFKLLGCLQGVEQAVLVLATL